MLAFNHLGRLGRLGNQMFQYASLRGIARNRGIDFCIPNHDYVIDDPFGFKMKIELFYPFVMSNVRPRNIHMLDRGYAPVAEERHFHFDEFLFHMCPDEISIAGFFQSEKYFKNIESEIREDFTFKTEILEPCKEMIEDVGEAIALHVRRTDYLKNPNHTTLDLDYYKKALKKFNKTLPVIIFSDDPEWCQDQELFSGDRFMVSESGDQYIDMCLMTLCQHHIIANSSFSWWGAWLSDSDDVVAPSKWFGAGNSGKDTKDLYAEGWQVI
jgi:hypothetical protein